MMKNIIILALLGGCVFAVETGSTQKKQETKHFMKKDSNATQVKVIEKKQYPFKVKEYPRGAIATH